MLNGKMLLTLYWREKNWHTSIGAALKKCQKVWFSWPSSSRSDSSLTLSLYLINWPAISVTLYAYIENGHFILFAHPCLLTCPLGVIQYHCLKIIDMLDILYKMLFLQKCVLPGFIKLYTNTQYGHTQAEKGIAIYSYIVKRLYSREGRGKKEQRHLSVAVERYRRKHSQD